MSTIIVITPEELQSIIREVLQQVLKEQKEDLKEKSYLTRKAVCKQLHITYPTLNTLTKSAKIKALKIGGRVLYSPTDVTDSLTELAICKYPKK